MDSWNDDISQESTDFLFRKTQDVYRDDDEEETEEAKWARLHRVYGANPDLEDLATLGEKRNQPGGSGIRDQQHSRPSLWEQGEQQAASDEEDDSDTSSYYSCWDGSGGSAPEEETGKMGCDTRPTGKSTNFISITDEVANQCESSVIFIPKRFDGTDSWQAYKCHFLNCKEGNGWSDSEACRYLKARLEGDATLVLTHTKNKTLSELLGALDTRYGVAAPDFVVRARLRDMLQDKDQSLQSYADSLNKAVVGRPGEETVEAKIVLEQFLHGLHDIKVKRYVCKRQPTELQEALKLAHECVEIEKWMADSTFRQQWPAEKVSALQDEMAKLKSENAQLRQELKTKDEVVAAVKAQTARTFAEIKESQGFIVRQTEKFTPNEQIRAEYSDSSSSGSYSADSDDLFDDSARKARRARNKRFKNNYPPKNRTGRQKWAGRAVGPATEADIAADSDLEPIQKVVQAVTRERCPGDSYYVWAEIDVSVPNVLFVLDTGAMVSLLNKKVFDEIPECARPVVRDTTATLTSVNTQSVRTYGIVTLEINLQGVRFKHDFWLCDMSESGIIGMDLLRAQKAIIDFSRDRVMFGAQFVRVSNGSGAFVKNRVVACRNVQVPPGHEAIIPCKTYQKRVKQRSNRCPISMVRPSRSALVYKGLAVARCMVNTAATVIPM